MADWQTVRYDLSYEEKIDPEILDLCDVLNETGFKTTSSCCGHGFAWPHVWMSGEVSDERYEKLARFLLKNCFGYLPRMQKEIVLKGHDWCLEFLIHDMYGNTPQKEALVLTVRAINDVALLVRRFAKNEKGMVY